MPKAKQSYRDDDGNTVLVVREQIIERPSGVIVARVVRNLQTGRIAFVMEGIYPHGEDMTAAMDCFHEFLSSFKEPKPSTDPLTAHFEQVFGVGNVQVVRLGDHGHCPKCQGCLPGPIDMECVHCIAGVAGGSARVH